MLRPEDFSTTSQPWPAERIGMEKGFVVITRWRGTAREFKNVVLFFSPNNIIITVTQAASLTSH
jgi:hypothetical protein